LVDALNDLRQRMRIARTSLGRGAVLAGPNGQGSVIG
jgi:hypothetical protein